jgi:hypothetical protein
MPFAPGDPRINRNGRPKKENCLTDILREMGNVADVSNNGDMIDRKQALAEAIWRKAIVDKDLAAIRYIYDRIDGMPHASMDMEIDGHIEGITVAIVDRTCNRASE